MEARNASHCVAIRDTSGRLFDGWLQVDRAKARSGPAFGHVDLRQSRGSAQRERTDTVGVRAAERATVATYDALLALEVKVREGDHFKHPCPLEEQSHSRPI